MLLEQFSAALTPEMLEYLVTATNQLLVELHEGTPQEIETLTGAPADGAGARRARSREDGIVLAAAELAEGADCHEAS